jgi:hypothetical protein
MTYFGTEVSGVRPTRWATPAVLASVHRRPDRPPDDRRVPDRSPDDPRFVSKFAGGRMGGGQRVDGTGARSAREANTASASRNRTYAVLDGSRGRHRFCDVAYFCTSVARVKPRRWATPAASTRVLTPSFVRTLDT